MCALLSTIGVWTVPTLRSLCGTRNQMLNLKLEIFSQKMKFKVFTVGWEPCFINYLLTPIEKKVGIEFVHGLVGDASRIYHVQKQYPLMKFTALSKTNKESLPVPDYELLSSLECVGVPTVKSMIQGDRVLRHRSEIDALGYATLLAVRIRDALEDLRPDVVLGGYDSIHSAMSLCVAKYLGVPWVAMAFPVIPDDLTGFCNGLTPNSLLPITRPVDERLRRHAKSLIQNVRSREQQVVAYRAPVSLRQWVKQYLQHGRNFFWRKQRIGVLGVDRFIYPSNSERLYDITRRTFNRLRLPIGNMLNSPPETRFVYYPLHMAPESTVDTWAPFYQNQLALISQISLAMPVDIAFVVKLHFSDPDNYSRKQLLQLMNMPNLYIAHPSAPGNAFIEKSSLVIGIQGTTCIEAALLGKPVLIFGDSPYQYFPRSERAKQPDELYEQIRRMLDLSPPSEEDIVESFANYMARYMRGRTNDWGRPVQPDELDHLADCFRTLGSYVMDPVNRANWYQKLPFLN